MLCSHFFPLLSTRKNVFPANHAVPTMHFPTMQFSPTKLSFDGIHSLEMKLIWRGVSTIQFTRGFFTLSI